MKKNIGSIAAIIVLVLVIIVVGVFNYVSLQVPMNDVQKDDPRAAGIVVSVHYGSYVYRSTLDYDLQSVSTDRTMFDVFRLFAKYAAAMKDRDFGTVELRYNGDLRYTIQGGDFRDLGDQYAASGDKGLIALMSDFPQHLIGADGKIAFQQRSGGLPGMIGHQMQDFAEFQRQWYAKDLPATLKLSQ